MPLALGTPRVPFGNEKAENTAWLNQKDFSWLGAVDAVRRGEGDVCRNKVDHGHEQEQKNKGGWDSSGIRRPKLRKVHTILWFQFPPSYHALILHECPPSNGTMTGSETRCQKSPAVQGFRRSSELQSPAGAETIFGELRSRNVGTWETLMLKTKF